MAFGVSGLCYQFVYTGSAKGSGYQSQNTISVKAPSHVISLARHKDDGPCRVGCLERCSASIGLCRKSCGSFRTTKTLVFRDGRWAPRSPDLKRTPEQQRMTRASCHWRRAVRSPRERDCFRSQGWFPE